MHKIPIYLLGAPMPGVLQADQWLPSPEFPTPVNISNE